MHRETTPLSLPTSKIEVELVTYYTLEEDDEINRYGLEGAEAVIVVDETTGQEHLNVKNIPVDRNRREIRKLLQYGIVSAKRGEENLSVGEAFVKQLPRQDVELLTDRLLQVRSGETADPKAPASGTETP